MDSFSSSSPLSISWITGNATLVKCFSSFLHSGNLHFTSSIFLSSSLVNVIGFLLVNATGFLHFFQHFAWRLIYFYHLLFVAALPAGPRAVLVERSEER